MPDIIFQRQFGGLPEGRTTSSKAVEAKSNKYSFSNGMSIFRDGFRGHFSSADVFDTTFGDGGSEVNSLLRSSTTDIGIATPKTYMISGGLSATAPKIILENSSAIQAGDDIGLPGAHSGHNFTFLPNPGTGFWGEDTIIYKHNLSSISTRSLFYSWNDNTDGDIGKGALSATLGTNATLDDDFMSTTPASGAVLETNVPHKFAEGADKILYCTNGQYLASYDGNTGANGTFNSQALNIGAGWVIVSIRRFGNFIVGGVIKSTTSNAFAFEGENKIFFWDGFSPDPNFTYEISDSRLTAIIIADGILYAFTIGKNNTTKIWRFNGTEFKLLAEQLSSVIGAPPTQNAVDYFNGSIHWLAGAGSSAATKDLICAFGPLSSKNKGIHIPMVNTDGSNNSTGELLKNVEQGVLRISGLYGATYKLNQNSSNHQVNSEFRTRVVELSYKSNITKIKVEFSQFAAASSVRLSLVRGYNTLATAGDPNDLLDTTITTTTFPRVDNDFMVNLTKQIRNLSSFYMLVTFNHSAITDTAAIIKRIIVTFEPTDKA